MTFFKLLDKSASTYQQLYQYLASRIQQQESKKNDFIPILLQNNGFNRQKQTSNLQKADAEFIEMLTEILVFNAINIILLYIISETSE